MPSWSRMLATVASLILERERLGAIDFDGHVQCSHTRCLEFLLCPCKQTKARGCLVLTKVLDLVYELNSGKRVSKTTKTDGMYQKYRKIPWTARVKRISARHRIQCGCTQSVRPQTCKL